MDNAFYQRLDSELGELRAQGLFKNERVISSPQGGQIRANDADVINLCANNYLGLANHPSIREAAHRALDRYGYGMASVRFICGTQSLHKQLESALSRFLGTEDTILYSSCWDANGGLFETVLGERTPLGALSDSSSPPPPIEHSLWVPRPAVLTWPLLTRADGSTRLPRRTRSQRAERAHFPDV